MELIKELYYDARPNKSQVFIQSALSAVQQLWMNQFVTQQSVISSFFFTAVP